MKKIELAVFENYDYKTLIETLVEFLFERKEMVIKKGEFAVRGDIVDIFPSDMDSPIRIEFDLNKISRLNIFNLHNQRVIKNINEICIKPYEKKEKDTFTNLTEQNFDKNVISHLFKGDYIIHEDYGLGIYKGLEYKEFNNNKGEYIIIEYKNKDTVYVPITQFKKIHTYTQTDKPPQLHSLNSVKWNQQKQKAIEDSLELAESLFQTHKIRQTEKGYKFRPDTDLQLQIENEFVHTLTEDQQKAMKDIKQDMESEKPMERLLCGDVGFGKTELLVRATLKALENQKQVAILTPTTLLTEQHLDTFKKRLQNTPYIIKKLSRFVEKKEQKKVIDQLKLNQCDCVIGTHRLLSKDVKFDNLGLLIIDEEQRFGVKHKERIKQIKQNVDIINVSATPIPRTLYLSLTGAKDISVIETPPKNRKPIITTINTLENDIIKTAIQKELKRKGQVFYIYNSIQGIHKKASEIQSLLPDLKIGIAHGKMKETHIKKITEEFIKKKYDCLLSTTIIENGLDIPNANTIILDSVERFGLSQIHQLRGRVGRSHSQAYAYLLFNNKHTLPEKAQKRLQAIQEYVCLGSGYDIALKDLEIRGAGNFFGKEQHGHIVNVGFSYFCKLIEESVSIKKGKQIQRPIKLDTHFITIPETYIENQRERIAMYLKILNCYTYKKLIQIQNECEDRYGKLNHEMKTIFEYVEKSLN